MSSKNDALRAFYEEMGESVLRTDDAELEQEYRESGKSLKEDADLVRQLLGDTWKTFQQRALSAAKEKHRERTARISASTCQLPTSPTERRRLLSAVIAKHQQEGKTLIAQHREFKEMTDEDVESWLQQFGQLGLLNVNSESNE